MKTAQSVAVTGASGLVGRALCASLERANVEVIRFSRQRGAGAAFWDPRSGLIDTDALRHADVVVHLAGASIADARWSDSYRREIRESRTLGTSLVARTLASLGDRQRVLIAASAVGYYGDTGAARIEEGAPRGAGFLAEVVEAWEEAAHPARAAGVRVVHPRFGIVLSSQGGALAKMLPAFRLGGGGPIGTGKQYMSWIAIDDVVNAVRWAIDSPQVSGVVNVTSPNPLTNEEFSATLARVLHRPALVRVPAFAIRALFGAMGDEALLAGSRVIPRRLLDGGFGFSYPDLETALRHLLSR